MATSIKPIGQRVLAKRIDEDETSAGGIIIPDSAREKPQEAQIIAVGTGGKNEDGSDFEFTVKVGDKVLISKYGGTDIKLNGEDHLILAEGDILGILD